MRLQINKSLFFRRKNQGYAALVMVTVIGITSLLGLMSVFRRGVRSHEAQVKNQIKVDYRQKEDALLRALVAIVPNKAIGAMMSNSAGDTSGINGTSQYGWEEIFVQAIADANADTAVDDIVLSSFGITNTVINANTGDNAGLLPANIAAVIAGTGTFAGEGITTNAALRSWDADGKLPEALVLGAGGGTAGAGGPIISKFKNYLTPTVAKFPRYNSIPYPNIRFGLAAQGQNFVAKRNWWAFKLTFGQGVSIANNGGAAALAMPVVEKNYVLSIYEVPDQLALSAGARLQLGTYQNGSSWQNTTITGRAFGSEVTTGGSVSMEGISSRRKITIGGGTNLNGVAVESGFDALGTREARLRTEQTDFYGASTAGDSGRVAILPLSQGNDFLRRGSNMSGTLSPTAWEEYAWGAKQCAMEIEIVRMETSTYNQPTRVKFHYYVSGVKQTINFYSGSRWVNRVNDKGEGGPEQIPFYWQNLSLENTSLVDPDRKRNPALVINLERFKDFLSNIGADSLDVNNSLSIWSNASKSTVSLPSIPSKIDPTKPNEPDEMAVVIRDGNDMKDFTSGFSIVTDHRVYIGGNINQVPVSPPAGSGVSGTYYPPVSIYAAEKRFGTNDTALETLTVDGQLSSLQEDDGTTVNPLDFKGGTTSGAVAKSAVTTRLSQIISPAQLPPVNKMTWLVTIEEIQP